MIRITGGEWRGRKLRAPAGRATRPTPVRVRAALFNVLGPAVRDGEFYDLFAGSGVVAFEALSRGAPRAVLVESARAALACVGVNAETLGCADRVDVRAGRLPDWLESGAFAPTAPATVFLAPPYYGRLGHAVLQALGRVDVDWGESVCVAQVERGEGLERTYGPWRLSKTYPHGLTALWLYEATG